MQRDAGAAVRHPRQPTGARGRPRRRPGGGVDALAARRRHGPVRRLAGGDRRAAARAARRHVDPRQHGALGGRPRRRTASRPRSGIASGRARSATRSPTSSARCPRAPTSATARAPGTARRCPTCSRSCPSRATTRPSCSRASTDRRLVFGHYHLPFQRSRGRRHRARRPGRVGIPLDGDQRAAYALMHDDGRIERRRVAYDHAASAARCARSPTARRGAGSSPGASSARA